MAPAVVRYCAVHAYAVMSNPLRAGSRSRRVCGVTCITAPPLAADGEPPHPGVEERPGGSAGRGTRRGNSRPAGALRSAPSSRRRGAPAQGACVFQRPALPGALETPSSRRVTGSRSRSPRYRPASDRPPRDAVAQPPHAGRACDAHPRPAPPPSGPGSRHRLGSTFVEHVRAHLEEGGQTADVVGGGAT